MYLRCRSFWWPCGCIGVMHMVLPDAAQPGLHRKPLDAAIRQLLALYCPGGHQGNSQQNNDDKIHPLCWPFWWPLQCNSMIPRASPDGWSPLLYVKPLDTTTRQAFAWIRTIGHAEAVFLSYVNRHVAEIGCKVKGWSTLTIGVWN